MALLFEEALLLASRGQLLDAIATFNQIAKLDKKAEYADDALYNSGLCHFQMRFYHDAIANWTRLIQAYPNAKILAVNGAREFGRTAAKAYLGRIHAYLALGDVESARKDLEPLKAYTDSYVVDPQGKKRTFHELACEALAAVKTV